MLIVPMLSRAVLKSDVVGNYSNLQMVELAKSCTYVCSVFVSFRASLIKVKQTGPVLRLLKSDG